MTYTKPILLASSIVVLLALTGIAGYGFYQIRYLSLPISKIYAFAAVLLPLVTFLAAQILRPLLRDQASISRNILWIILLSALQLIYDTIIATISLVYMNPGCSIEDKWKQMYSGKDIKGIRTIQDTFNCCGFNSPVDRAWPFPSKGHDDKQCRDTYGRTTSCRVPWEQQEKANAGFFFAIAAIVFIAKAIFVVIRFRRATGNQSPGWFTSSSSRGPNGNNHGRVRLIENGDGDVEENSVVEPYRDEAHDGQTEANHSNSNHGRPSVHPSGLINDAGNEWRSNA